MSEPAKAVIWTLAMIALSVIATLMLAGADYLTTPQLGEAWSILEIAAFTAWGICLTNKLDAITRK